MHKASGIAYSWSGTFPKVVAPGTDPTSGGFTDQSDKLLRPEITGRYAYVGRSLYDVLTPAERARVISGDSTFDLTAKIQAMIDQGGTFHLMAGYVHYCNGSLRMKSYAKMLGDVPATNSDSGRTILMFDENLTTVGVYLNHSNRGVYTHDWAIEGVAVRPKTQNIAKGFCCYKVEASGGISFGFKLHTDVNLAHTGLQIERDFWGGEINLHAHYCYRPYYQVNNTFSTSLTGWIKSSRCFNGPRLSGAMYCNLNLWTDKCGLTADTALLAQCPTNEMPIMLALNNCQGLSLTWGAENCKGQMLNASNYTNATINVMYWAAPSHLFKKDATRIANLPLAQQSLIYLASGSHVNITGMQCAWTDQQGYPAVDADPTYFFNTADTGDRNRLNLHGCYITMSSYQFAPTDAKYTEMYVDPAYNSLFGFGGAYWISPHPKKFTLGKTPIMRIGVPNNIPDMEYHQIYAFRPYAEGAAHFLVGGPYEASGLVTFADVYGANGSSAISSMRVPTSSTTGRSISAGGTVNTAGADYAEYMFKADGCGELAKGAICGVNRDGLLTDRFDEAISFVVKSTNPSFVGGDAWFVCDEPKEVGTDASEEEKAEYEAQLAEHRAALEEARQRVDRVAFSGQVPCNVIGAAPGDYIVPVRHEDGSIGGEAVTEPSFEQYRKSVGTVWKIADDERAWIAVKVS